MALLLQGFHSAVLLSEARNSHDEFCIPICVLAATISNDVPGTDISIGSDTSLNVVVQVRDLLLQFSSLPEWGFSSALSPPDSSNSQLVVFNLQLSDLNC